MCLSLYRFTDSKGGVHVMKSMKLSQYYEIINPTYECLKIIPHSSTRNYNSGSIAKMVANMYISVKQSIKWHERKFIMKSPLKCSYMIDIQKTDVSFLFIVPSQYLTLAKERILNTWNKCRVELVDMPVLPKGLIYSVGYENKDQLSLDVDSKNNYPLNSILNTIDIMEDDDRMLIMYNLMPCSQYGWKPSCDRIATSYIKGEPIKREISGFAMIYKVAYIIADFLDKFMDGIFKGEDNVFKDFVGAFKENINTISSDTKCKRNDTIIKTQIAVISHSKNENRMLSNMKSVCEGFGELHGDNRLVYQECFKPKINALDYKIKGIPINKFGTKECQNLIQLPGKNLLEEHHISHNNVIEADVPIDLQSGVMCLGDSKCKGTLTTAYLSTDKSYQYLTWVLIGPTRSGKTTRIGNTCYGSSKAKECNIILDWCGNCELSEDLKSTLKGHVDILEIECSDLSKSQGLGYNELYSTNDNADERYASAKKQSMQILTLVNSLQGGDEDLRARMERYLGAASLIVAINNGSIKDVFEVLQDYELRQEYIDKVPENQRGNLNKYIRYLNELNEVKNGVVIGTKLNAVQGILNRVTKLEQNTYMERMLQKDCSKNINLVDEMQKGRLILIKMPEGMFATEEEKDVYATYWLTKIWGALQMRKMIMKEKDAVKVNIYFDELYQVKNCQEFLRSKLSQIAKFWAKPIISCHYLGQISGIRNELKSANASYTIISGSDKDNYKELKSELYPFTEEDLLNLKRYHAINLIKCDAGYGKFITAPVKPIK